MVGPFGPYRVERKIGEGGMGVVYAARDERLGRTVALKTLHRAAADDESRRRLWREARTAASLSHPNICQVYDVGEHEGALYLAMELLEGESLAARLVRGALPLGETLDIGLAILAALDALHGRSCLHRDIKPTNVFLTPHGVKLLDFGLARAFAGADAAPGADITRSGTITGTPRYMAPEQWTGEAGDPSTDLFAVGCLLFEMMTGRPAFAGTSVPEIFHAVFHQDPPALSGEPEVMAVDRVIQRALARRPAERYPGAAAMAAELRAIRDAITTGAIPVARPLKRIVVLPFRMLRPDPDMEFLALGLANALTESLAGMDSLLVRSTAAVGRFAGEHPDLRALATEAAVDLALLGTVLRSGERVRVSTQLVATPGGDILASRTAEGTTGDLFALQDDLARAIVESISGPLSPGERDRLGHDVPEDPAAYECYVRANVLGANVRQLADAAALYRRCVERAPRFAPAWARLGRAHRVMAKFGMAERGENLRLSEEAFRRAFELNPDLSLAHNLYTYFELEEGARSREAMVRLLERAAGRPHDPELYAGLVLSCRFVGLPEASLAADRRARRLDPSVKTGVAYTYLMIGDFDSAAEYDEEEVQAIRAFTEAMKGNEQRMLERWRQTASTHPLPNERAYFRLHEAAVEGRREECIALARGPLGADMRDPEAHAGFALALARAGATDEALGFLASALDRGFAVHLLVSSNPWAAPVRADPRWEELARRSEAFTREAAAMYLAAGGERLLGVRAR